MGTEERGTVGGRMRIVYAPGCYDLLHEGHRNFLRRSKALGDFLIAGIVTDDGAAAYKRRPVQPEQTRLGNVRDLRYVDLAVLQPGTDPTPVLRSLVRLGIKPDLLTHGDDWQRLREGHETLEELGIGWALVPYTHGVSTTDTIQVMEAR